MGGGGGKSLGSSKKKVNVVKDKKKKKKEGLFQAKEKQDTGGALRWVNQMMFMAMQQDSLQGRGHTAFQPTLPRMI